MPTVKVVGLRIVASRAVVMTALGKNRHADSGAVDKRFGFDTRNAQPRSFFLFHNDLHTVLHAIVHFGTLGVVEAIDGTNEVTRDAADAFESDSFTVFVQFFIRHLILLTRKFD